MLDSFGVHDRAPPSPASAPNGPGLSIRPEVFLYPRWRGTGTVFDSFGLPRDRYRLHGGGRTEPDGAVVIEHRAEFESGAVSAYDWVFGAAPGKLIVARDRLNGIEARGEMTSNGFRWAFRAVGHKGLMVGRARIEIGYRILNGREAESSVTLCAFGVKFGAATGLIRHDL